MFDMYGRIILLIRNKKYDRIGLNQFLLFLSTANFYYQC